MALVCNILPLFEALRGKSGGIFSKNSNILQLGVKMRKMLI